MSLNTLRLNHQASSHPNERIVFIKPLPRPPSQKDDYDRAELVLKAIAAQCLPIMKEHYLSVTTLEEYEPNPEFIGRNFNNGEIIQLVIRSKSGAWLPLNMIQMVMMHELAHNTHMNHGKGFWQARNLYAGEMRGLWARGYTGEGLWGPGRTLSTMEQAMRSNMLQSSELADLPLCGGTFRSRGRKRKAKGQDLTWKEKRDKRIEKKFGKSGTALGEDEDRRLTLEINRKDGSSSLGSKPRVAQSKRGRELRAAAALARFGTNKKEVNELEAAVKKEEDVETETESEGEYEELDAAQEDAKDIDGRRLLDGKGQGMIRVCEEEDGDDVQVKNEMDELVHLDSIPPSKPENSKRKGHETKTGAPVKPMPNRVISSATTSKPSPTSTARQSSPVKSSIVPLSDSPPNTPNHRRSLTVTSDVPTIEDSAIHGVTTSETSCQICSMVNDVLRSTCVACAHVLDIRKDPRHWRCTSSSCKDSQYVNAGDCGVCGVCGARRSSMPQQNVQAGRTPRLTDLNSSHIAYL